METAFAEYISHAPVFVRRVGGEIVYWTEGAHELYGFGFETAMGRKSHELLSTVFPGRLADINKSLHEDGVWQGLLRHTRADGESIWVQSRWRLRRDDDLVVESNTDVTQRENLARELDHRVKNTLSVVQGLARLTFRGGGEQIEQFEQRLTALATAHNIILDHHWGPAGLREVIDRAVAPLGVRERIVLDGPDTLLRPNSVTAYILALHELATNALKHGAFLAPAGKVAITWRSKNDRVHVTWRETGGPPPAADYRPGAGTRLLERVVSAELGTQVKISLQRSGLVCEFDGPTQKQTAFEPTTSLPPGEGL